MGVNFTSVKGKRAKGSASASYRHGEIQHVNGKRIATPEYRSWQMMRNRCLNPQAKDWHYYGGRGITIDPRWDDYKNFLADMGRRPGPSYTLERKNNDGIYTKLNCIWDTRQAQARNRAYVKLSVSAAAAIRKAYAAGGVRQEDLAQQYGCCRVLISQIIRGVAWR